MADEMDDTPATRKKKETTPGVIYMSRLPPFMKPAKIRNIFSQYGEVGRLFLQPEGIYEIGLSLILVLYQLHVSHNISSDFSTFRPLFSILFEQRLSLYVLLFYFIADAAVRKKRKKHGGSGRKLFTEGWIEFKDKRTAKAVALSLNNTPFGNNECFLKVLSLFVPMDRQGRLIPSCFVPSLEVATLFKMLFLGLII